MLRRRGKGVRVRRLIVEPLENRSLLAAVITVNSTLDTNSRDSVLTLREAILVNNRTLAVSSLTTAEKAQVVGTPGSSDTDTIGFNISGTGVKTITPTSALPTITDSVVIDGYTQPGAISNSAPSGFNGTMQIELNGTNAGDANGLTITAGGSTVRGLVVNRFSGHGIALQSGGANTIESNFIGTDVTGTIDLGNTENGVLILNSSNNMIGGKASPSSAGGDVYFADFNEVLRFNVDQPTSLPLVSGGSPYAVALDVAGGKLYWTDLAAGVKRSNLDGSGAEKLVAGLGETRGIDLDLVGGKMYWIEQTLGFDKVFRANLNGTGREELPVAGLYNAFGIALDVTGGKMYWTDAGDDGVPNSDRIMRADLNGSNAEVLINTGLHFPFEIALDVSSGKMYWADGGGGGQGGPSTIKRANLDGTGVELLVSGSIIPHGIDLDLSARKMYWTDGFNVIRRANLDGTNVEDLLTSGFDVAQGIAVVSAVPGEGNLISGNGATGVRVAGGTGNTILGNSIYSNDELGINLTGGIENGNGVTANDAGDADNGANGLQNYPIITSVARASGRTQIQGTLNSVASKTYRIELFASDAKDPTGFGEGQTYLGSVNTNTDANGNATFTFVAPSLVAAGKFITATASPFSSGVAIETSEFSEAFAVQSGCSLTVINTNDTGAGSLREAITCANSTAGQDTISFNIPGTGVQTIAPSLPLPEIIEAVTIDGYTQPGAKVNTNGTEQGLNTVLKVELAGNLSGTTAVDGLTINGSGVTVRGLAIHSFSGTAIAIKEGGYGNTIEGNLLGTNAAGSAEGSKSGSGVTIDVSASQNLVGGTLPAARNLISGNTEHGVTIVGDANVVTGNLIGLDVTGTQPATVSASSGVFIGGGFGNIVGGALSAERNIISANAVGVSVASISSTNLARNTYVSGNFIGTDVTGVAAVGNSLGGILIDGSYGDSTIGGTGSGAGNLISGNGGFGVSVGRTFECLPDSCIAGSSAIIRGNYIGTDKTGLLDLGNLQGGVELGSSSFISKVGGVDHGIGLLGTGAFAGNLISGNKGNGLTITGSGYNAIQGNTIGTSRTGGSLGNTGDGIAVIEGYNNSIGGLPYFFSWPTSAGGNGHYYTITEFQGNWFYADDAARQLDGHLLSINSKAEQDFIVNAVLGGGAVDQTYWIGATDEFDEGTFRWTNGDPFTYTNWGAGEPNNLNGDENYVALNWDRVHQGGLLGTWSDLPQYGRTSDEQPESYFGIIELTNLPGKNIIAFNGRNGISLGPIDSAATTTVLGNSIFSNSGLGIDLGVDGATLNDLVPTPDADTGVNNLQNYPAISHAAPDGGKLKVTYTVPAATQNAGYPIHVEFFKADASGQEGQTFLGSDLFTETDFAAGGKTVAFSSIATIAGGDKLVATASDSVFGQPASTSEFSPGIAIASPWRNPVAIRRWDVTDDTHVVADDVLAIINYINAKGSGIIPNGAINEKPYCDVNGDNNVAADDVIEVINYINAGFGGEGESEQYAAATGAQDSGNEWLSLMAMDVAGQVRKKR